ncbi:MAG: class I SAM-dependent methyltransferase [Betaproteobacteria bacterium]|nr:class I SAM-dependent methyltransferase [Betaproteobacteria bacterium]
MLRLRRRQGRVLEPSCGDGAFSARLPGCTAIEPDRRHAPPGALHMDFFAYPETEKFDTIIGNPPYVRYQDIRPETRALLRHEGFDARTNLYLFFIAKCLRHLAPGGELIFITPRDFLKATSSVELNRWMGELGTITDAIDLGDARVFDGALPNCLIWRFEAGDFSRLTRYAEIGVGDRLEAALAAPSWEERHCRECAGHLLFTRGDYPLRFSDHFFVKVGAVSGLDEIYADPVHGNRSFVCSATAGDGHTRRMIWCEPGQPAPQALLPHKARLIARRIRPFDESNWWMWGRGYYQSERPRIYVNHKTRNARPFFLHRCTHYDGSVLAVFPHDTRADLRTLCAALNQVDWADLGFVCDGRYLFSQRSLENAPLPGAFATLVTAPGATPPGHEGT